MLRTSTEASSSKKSNSRIGWGHRALTKDAGAYHVPAPHVRPGVVGSIVAASSNCEHKPLTRTQNRLTLRGMETRYTP